MRFQNESTAEFAIDKNFLTITDAPGVTGSGGGRLCSSKCDQAPQWIPYIAPPVLGGRLVLELSNKKPDALAIKSKQDLMKAVLKVAKQMAAKSYTPNLSRILAQQGTGLLPKSVNAKLELQFDIYARSEKRAQISEYLKLEFPLNDAVRGSARFTHSVTSLGLHVDATLDLSRSPQDGQLEINVKTDRGETTSLRYSVETKELIRDGDRAVAPYLSINLVSPSSDEISLPGFGDFTSIDAYPGNELR